MKLKYISALISVFVFTLVASLVLSFITYKNEDASADNKTSVKLTQSISPTPSPTPADKIGCIRSALDKRENSVNSAFDEFSGSLRNALATRKNQLLDAWNTATSVEQRKATLAAWSKYRTFRQEAAALFNQKRNAAWSQYSTDRRTCGISANNESQSNDLSF